MMDYRIYRLKKAIEEYLKKSWTVEQMAKYVNVSTPHLFRIFKSDTGKTPISYLNDLRIEKARALLENTFLRVKEIRFLIAFPDQGHFVREFKKKVGMTPTAFRKKCWDEIQNSDTSHNKSDFLT